MAAWLLIKLIRAYQLIISPILANTCRYLPTCSAYMLEAIKYYGAIKGLRLGIKRIARCHPWHAGGFDPVPNIPNNSKKLKDKKTNR